jgi:hypothetical protein
MGAKQAREMFQSGELHIDCFEVNKRRKSKDVVERFPDFGLQMFQGEISNLQRAQCCEGTQKQRHDVSSLWWRTCSWTDAFMFVSGITEVPNVLNSIVQSFAGRVHGPRSERDAAKKWNLVDANHVLQTQAHERRSTGLSSR